MYAGIFLHFWGLFEWIISNIIFDNKKNLLKKLNHPEDKLLLKNLQKCLSSEDVLYKDNNSERITISKKLKLIKLLQPSINNPENSKIFRDQIAHNNISFYINMGDQQNMSGWIKKDYDKTETDLFKNMLIKAKKNNQTITDEEINTKIYLTYTISDIKNCIDEIIVSIKNLNYEISSDNVYLLLKKENIL